MTSAFIALLCAWNPEWSEADIQRIEAKAGNEFIPEISISIVARTSIELLPDECTLKVRVSGKIERCDELRNKTHLSYCRDHTGEEENYPKFRIYIETISACSLDWQSKISTPADKDPKMLGSLFQHVIISHLGLRTNDYVNILNKMSYNNYNHCEDIHDVKSEIGEIIRNRGLKNLGCLNEFRVWTVFSLIVKSAVGLFSFFILPLSIFCTIYEHEIFEAAREQGYEIRRPLARRPPREAQERGVVIAAAMLTSMAVVMTGAVVAAAAA